MIKKLNITSTAIIKSATYYQLQNPIPLECMDFPAICKQASAQIISRLNHITQVMTMHLGQNQLNVSDIHLITRFISLQ